jgi:ubiquinone/menaquinone biosynthesis C-methylase UbiE
MTGARFDAEKYTEQARRSWSDTAADYDRVATDAFTAFTPDFVDFAGIASGQRVLDVACGPGLASIEAAGRVGPKGSVLGVDLAPGMLQVASRKAKALGADQLSFREMNAERLELEEGRFDAVICQLGLMLFTDPAKALKEMTRVVRKGGRVACLVQGDPEKMVVTSLLNKTVLRHAPQLKVPGAPNIYSFAAPGVLEKAFSAAGLTEIAVARREGHASFESADAYWDRLTASSGRLKPALQSLEPGVREAIRLEVLEAARAYLKDGRLELPLEVVMAKGIKG